MIMRVNVYFFIHPEFPLYKSTFCRFIPAFPRLRPVSPIAVTRIKRLYVLFHGVFNSIRTTWPFIVFVFFRSCLLPDFSPSPPERFSIKYTGCFWVMQIVSDLICSACYFIRLLVILSQKSELSETIWNNRNNWILALGMSKRNKVTILAWLVWWTWEGKDHE